MHLEPTHISDLNVLRKPIREDERGVFCRLYADDEIKKVGRNTKAVHVNSSTSLKEGTIRGIHYQYPPFAEEKIVSCVHGSIWDVAVDLRPDSSTRFQWFGLELSPLNGLSLIVPRGFGHAFITLEPNATVIYAVSTCYSIEHESGARFDDPLININWPIKPSVLSPKDHSWLPLSGRINELNDKFNGLD